MGEPRAVQRMTLEEYLAFEEKSLHKHEFYNGEVFAMASALPNHNRIVSNSVYLFGSLLRERKCEVFPSDMRLRVVAKNLFTYPDVSVVCNKPLFHGNRSLLNPILLIEVLSKSTANYDRGKKFNFYRSIPSLQEYLMIDSRSVQVEKYRCTGLTEWTFTEYASPDDIVVLECIDVEVRVADLYRHVDFEMAAGDEDPRPTDDVPEEDIRYA